MILKTTTNFSLSLIAAVLLLTSVSINKATSNTGSQRYSRKSSDAGELTTP